jgi:hypothetical protein
LRLCGLSRDSPLGCPLTVFAYCVVLAWNQITFECDVTHVAVISTSPLAENQMVMLCPNGLNPGSHSAGLQLGLVQERERDCLDAWVFPEPDHRLEVSDHEQAGHVDRPHASCTVPCHVPGWPNHCDRCWRRDIAFLECLPWTKGASVQLADSFVGNNAHANAHSLMCKFLLFCSYYTAAKPPCQHM